MIIPLELIIGAWVSIVLVLVFCLYKFKQYNTAVNKLSLVIEWLTSLVVEIDESKKPSDTIYHSLAHHRKFNVIRQTIIKQISKEYNIPFKKIMEKQKKLVKEYKYKKEYDEETNK